ncbi:MAG TPA: hypothetical protein VKA25_11415 [Gemmatimonadales bacterium]|nr:hypothetical protein [Gemmatimonadales bacterium]
MSSQSSEGEVSPALRFHLAREYAALDAAGKSRFKQNLKLGPVTTRVHPMTWTCSSP